MNEIIFSKEAFKHYFFYLIAPLLDEDGNHPDEPIQIYSTQIPSLRDVLIKFDDLERFKVGLEYFILPENFDAFNSFEFQNDSNLHWFEKEELTSLFKLCYEELFPDANLNLSMSNVELTWINQLWIDWVKDKNLLNIKNGLPLIINYRYSREEFQLLLRNLLRVQNDSNNLRGRSESDVLNDKHLDELEINLINNHHLNWNGDVHEKIAKPLAKIISSGWKLMFEIQGGYTEWQQGFLHITKESIVGEAINEDKDRLISDFRSVDEAISWLTETLAIDKKDATNLPSQFLESLSDQLTATVRFAILNTSESQPAKAAAGWLVTEDAIWFIDQNSEQNLAKNVSFDELIENVSEFVQRNVPADSFPN